MPCYCWQNHICFCFTLVALLIICSWIGKKIRRKKNSAVMHPRWQQNLLCLIWFLGCIVPVLIILMILQWQSGTRPSLTQIKGEKIGKQENRNKILMEILKEDKFNHNTTESNGTKCDWSWKSEENQHFPASAEDAAALKAQQKDAKIFSALLHRWIDRLEMGQKINRSINEWLWAITEGDEEMEAAGAKQTDHINSFNFEESDAVWRKTAMKNHSLLFFSSKTVKAIKQSCSLGVTLGIIGVGRSVIILP